MFVIHKFVITGSNQHTLCNIITATLQFTFIDSLYRAKIKMVKILTKDKNGDI